MITINSKQFISALLIVSNVSLKDLMVIETFHKECNRYRVTRLFYYFHILLFSVRYLYMLMVNVNGKFIWLISSIYPSCYQVLLIILYAINNKCAAITRNSQQDFSRYINIGIYYSLDRCVYTCVTTCSRLIEPVFPRPACRILTIYRGL